MPVAHHDPTPPRFDVEPRTPSPGLGALGLILGIGGFVAVFGILGLIYLPMALTANSIFGYPWACINPVFIWRSIRAAGRDYAVCVIAFFAVFICSGVLEWLARINFLFFFLGIIPACLIEMYAQVIQMRLLGLFFRYNQGRLGWLIDRG